MALRVTCTACSNVVLVPATARTVACLKCGERMTLPRTEHNSGEDEVVDEPMPARLPISIDRPRRPSRPKPEGLPKWVLVLMIALPMVTVVGGGIVWALMNGNAKKIAVATKKEPTPTPAPEAGLAPIEWTKFETGDGSFVAEFPNGPPQAVSDNSGSGAVIPGLPGFGGALGEGDKATDLAKELGIEAAAWHRVDPVGTFTISYSSMPALLGNAQTVEGMLKEVKVGPRPDGSDVFAVEDCQLGGYAGKRVLTKNGTQLVDKRMTKVKGRLFTVIAVVPYDGKGDSAVLKYFFKKFAIKNVPDPKPLNLPGLQLPEGFDPLKP